MFFTNKTLEKKTYSKNTHVFYALVKFLEVNGTNVDTLIFYGS